MVSEGGLRYGDLKHLPILTQLKDLFKVLEPKFTRSSFSDSLGKWSIDLQPIRCKGDLVENHVPHPKDLCRIIQALSEIGRVGQADYAIFSVPDNIAIWVIAFVEWSLGSPPLISPTSGRSTDDELSQWAGGELLDKVSSLDRVCRRVLTMS